MEYCNQGTLWSAAKSGLAPQVIRRYTKDILRAVDHLHDSGIIHRDIKGKRCVSIGYQSEVMTCVCCVPGANIFLSDDSVKLGDFGLSVQLKNMQKTQFNEIKRQRGTIREFQLVCVCSR